MNLTLLRLILKDFLHLRKRLRRRIQLNYIILFVVCWLLMRAADLISISHLLRWLICLFRVKIWHLLIISKLLFNFLLILIIIIVTIKININNLRVKNFAWIIVIIYKVIKINIYALLLIKNLLMKIANKIIILLRKITLLIYCKKKI